MTLPSHQRKGYGRLLIELSKPCITCRTLIAWLTGSARLWNIKTRRQNWIAREALVAPGQSRLQLVLEIHGNDNFAAFPRRCYHWGDCQQDVHPRRRCAWYTLRTEPTLLPQNHGGWASECLHYRRHVAGNACQIQHQAGPPTRSKAHPMEINKRIRFLSKTLASVCSVQAHGHVFKCSQDTPMPHYHIGTAAESA